MSHDVRVIAVTEKIGPVHLPNTITSSLLVNNSISQQLHYSDFLCLL